MDEIERRTRLARRFYRRRGESSPACVVCVCGMRVVGLADYRWTLPRISIVLRPPIANPPNSAQLGGIPYHSPNYIRVHAIVWTCGRGHTHRQTDRHTQTDTQTRVTTIHSSWSTTHAKCNQLGCRNRLLVCSVDAWILGLPVCCAFRMYSTDAKKFYRHRPNSNLIH